VKQRNANVSPTTLVRNVKSLLVNVMQLVQRKKLVKRKQGNANVNPTTLVRNVKSLLVNVI
jgi:hypothetical protein